MPGTKIRIKISLIKMMSILTIFVVFAVAFLAPSGRIEWSEKTLGIKEEYYANVSWFQIMFGTDVEVHSKTLENMDELGNSFGISKGNFDATFGTLDLSKLEKEPVQVGGYGSLIMITVMFVAYYIFLILPQKKIQKKLNEIELLLEEQPLRSLPRKEREAFLNYRLGINPNAWQSIFIYPLCLIIPYFFIAWELNGVDNYVFTPSVIFIVGFLAATVLVTAIMQVFVNSTVNEILKYNITSKEQLTDPI